MAKRGRIAFDEHERAALLHRITAWRRDCQGIQARAPVRGDVYMAVSGIMAAIDATAGVLTGNSEHLWNKPHSISEGPRTGRAADGLDAEGLKAR